MSSHYLHRAQLFNKVEILNTQPIICLFSSIFEYILFSSLGEKAALFKSFLRFIRLTSRSSYSNITQNPDASF